MRTEDFHCAADYLSTQPYVGNIGVMGICGGGFAISAAITDHASYVTNSLEEIPANAPSIILIIFFVILRTKPKKIMYKDVFLKVKLMGNNLNFPGNA